MQHDGAGPADSPQALELVLELSSVRELYSGLAPSLATDGLFVEVQEPAPPGSTVRLRVELPGSVAVLEARGTVLWVRTESGGEGPSGMAVRFDRLSRSTRETIDAVIDAHLAGGGELFDLDGGSDGGVFPTDSLQGRPAALLPGRWREAGGEVVGRASSADPRAALLGSAAEADVIDLRFEEVLHGLAPAGEAEDARKRQMDRAIAAAVSPPQPVAGDAEPPQPQEAPNGEPAGDGDEIPAILDGWRREIDEGLDHLARARGQGGPEDRLLDGASAGRLPFDADQPDLETRPVVVDDLTTARRSPPAAPATWTWWLAGGAALALLAVVLAFLWPGRAPAGREPAPSAAASPIEGIVVAKPDAIDSPAASSDASPGQEPAARDAAAPPAEPPAALEGSVGSRVLSIDWRALAGSTEIVLRTTDDLDEGEVDTLVLDDPPRVLVRLRGIEVPYTPYRVEVGTPEVSAIRIGHHPEFDPPELYVVLDGAAAPVSVASRSVDGDTLRVVVRSGS